jgi:predicted alpha/beta superfamily hydrolase
MWVPYTSTVKHHTVVGDLRRYSNLYSPQLDNQRDLLIWLPPSYHTSTKSYPVIYMHDGQNLFDAHTSYSGEWQVDETMTRLSRQGAEAIIVGISHAGVERLFEYNPFPNYPYRIRNRQHTQGRGDDYLRFIVDTIKPMIDAQFRTLSDPMNTAIAGSSMGGLISLYGFLSYQYVFGLCGAFSPSMPTNNHWQTVLSRADGAFGKLYLFVGGEEGGVFRMEGTDFQGKLYPLRRPFVEGVFHLRDRLQAHGFDEGRNFKFVLDPNADHSERTWSRWVGDAFDYLLQR